MVRFTLRQCTYFRAVAEQGGIAQAAKALNISQPSVAQAIDKLEAVTGLVLFERHHARGLTLTMQGRLFLEHVTLLDAQAEWVSNQAQALANESAGEVRLGAFWTLAPFFLPSLVSGFLKTCPHAAIQHSEMGLAALGAALREGEIDLALTYDRGTSLERLEVTRLAALQPQAFVSANHPLAQRDSVTAWIFQICPDFPMSCSMVRAAGLTSRNCWPRQRFPQKSPMPKLRWKRYAAQLPQGLGSLFWSCRPRTTTHMTVVLSKCFG